MVRWRIEIGVILFLALGVPALAPFVELFSQTPNTSLAGTSTTGNSEASEFLRVISLARNTSLLVLGTLAGTLVPGTFLAVLLFRTDLPLRGLLTFLLILAIFIPLPVLTSTWQALLGGQSWLPATLWPARPGQPWTQGLLPSVWVHSLASLPWVVLIVGQALRWVEAELEEDALLDMGPWAVIARISVPRCRPAMTVAALWVTVQTMGEVGVTDMFQFRTFAEEVYYAYSSLGQDAQARAVLVALPVTLLLWLLIVVIGPRLLNAFPALEGRTGSVRAVPLTRFRWPALIVVLSCVFLLVGIPVTTMFWNAGYRNEQTGWSAQYFRTGLEHTLVLNGPVLVSSFLGALVTGTVVALLALLACWAVFGQQHGQRSTQFGLLLLVALLWATPGPVAGYGLKSVISLLLKVFGRGSLVAELLYYGRSPVPIWWAHALRTFPFAVALLWPVVRLMPREVLDSARLDGATPLRELLWITLPQVLPVVLSAALVFLALSLGEISASKLVATPGVETFTQVVFDRMHYGVSQDVAAMCLLLLALLAMGGLEAGVRLAGVRLAVRPR